MEGWYEELAGNLAETKNKTNSCTQLTALSPPERSGHRSCTPWRVISYFSLHPSRQRKPVPDAIPPVPGEKVKEAVPA